MTATNVRIKFILSEVLPIKIEITSPAHYCIAIFSYLLVAIQSRHGTINTPRHYRVLNNKRITCNDIIAG